MNNQLPEIYAQAIVLARANKQIVGDKNDYYITLEQLEKILILVRDGLGEM